jgi:HEAT repeat protein
MQLAIVAALSAAGGEAAVEGLARILLGGGVMAWLTGSRSQVSAAEALGRIGGATAREALQRGLRTRRRAVRDACRRALATVTDKNSARGSER